MGPKTSAGKKKPAEKQPTMDEVSSIGKFKRSNNNSVVYIRARNLGQLK